MVTRLEPTFGWARFFPVASFSIKSFIFPLVFFMFCDGSGLAVGQASKEDGSSLKPANMASNSLVGMSSASAVDRERALFGFSGRLK